IWPIEERPVPPSDVPGERASPTQPFPTKPAPFEYQGVTVDDLIDFAPELRAMALEAIRPFRIGPLYTPPSLVTKGGTQGTIIRPAPTGGANWAGAAVDPETGMLYVPSRHTMGVLRLQSPTPAQRSTLRYMEARSGDLPLPRLPGGLPLFKPPYSRMTAIDMNRGEHVWMVPLGDGNTVRNHPMLKGLNLPPLGGDSSTSGPLLTKTLLISALTAGGPQHGPPPPAPPKGTREKDAARELPGAAHGPLTKQIL